MKKLTAIIAAAVCLIIGGVYATWTYSTGNVATTHVEVKPTITDKAEPTAAGTITIDSTLSIVIDDKMNGEVAGNDWIAEVYYSGAMVITFAPKANSSSDILTNGIDMEMHLFTTTAKYNSKEIFHPNDNVNGNDITVTTLTSGRGSYSAIYAPEVGQTVAELNAEHQIGKVEKLSNGNFVWTITATQLSTLIEFNAGDALELKTYDEHTAFTNAITASNILIRVGQKGIIKTDVSTEF